MKKNKKIILYPVASILLFLLFIGASNAFAAKSMPNFSLVSVTDERLVSSEEFKGKVALITFFATWCQPCVMEVGSLKKLQDELGGDDFSVLAISVDVGSVSKVKQFVESKMINYPVVTADQNVTQGFEGVYGIPASFLIDKNSNVVKKYVGYQPHSVFERDIKSLL